MRRGVFTFFVGFFLLLETPITIGAQATAQISGTVKDQSGAVLPGVEVTATQTETGAARTTVTNETGSYALPNLPLGPYRLEAGLPGFRTFLQSGIILQVNSSPAINPVLEVGQVSEQVEVQANAAMVETRNAGVGQVIENQRILELPLNGRNVAELITLAGAATQAGTTSNRAYSGQPIVSVAGGLLSGVGYMLDGAIHVDAYNGQSLPLPFPDALQEFKVETGGLSAQNGKGATVGAVTKAGTNEFHGDVFDFVRNDLFNARNYFATTGSTLKRHQLGGTVGGPVLKNKLFFFGGYQETTVRQDPADRQSFVPTAAMLAGDFTAFASPACNNGRQINLRAPFVNNRIDPGQFNKQAVLIAGYLPKTSDACGLITYGLKTTSNEGQVVGKVDYQRNNNHSLFGRYVNSFFRQPFPYSFDKNVLNTGTSGYSNMVQSFAFGDTYIFSTSLVNAFRLTANKYTTFRKGAEFFGPADVGINAFTYVPKYMIVNVTGGFAIGNVNTIPQTLYRTSTLAASDDLNIIRGTHQIAFGANVTYAMINAQSKNSTVPNFSFNGQETGLGMADYFLGKPDTYLQGAPSNAYEIDVFPALYAQDAWKAKPNLTVNAGLRWEPYLPFYIRQGWVFNFNEDRFHQGIHSTVFPKAPAGLYYPGDPGFPGKSAVNKHCSQFGPRLGLAWDVNGDGRTSVRASYGISYEHIGLYWFSDILTAGPWYNRTNILSPPGGLTDPWAGFPGGNYLPLQAVTAQNAFWIPYGDYLNRPYDNVNPYTEAWNLTLQRQVTSDWLTSASYIGTSSIHTWEMKTRNPGIYLPGGPCTLNGVTYNPCSSTSNINQRRKFTLERPQDGQYLGRVSEYEDGGTMSYHGMRLTLERRVTSGATFSGNYTWSHCIGEVGGTTDQGPSIGTGYPNLYDRHSDRGNCASSRRHIVNLTTVAESPKFSNRTARILATGWRLSGIYRWSTGSYLTVTDAYLLLTAPKAGRPSKREARVAQAKPELKSAPINSDSEPAPVTVEQSQSPLKHKSQKQIMKELQRIGEQEQERERQADAQLATIVTELDRKARAQWLEFPDRLAAHAKALVELAEHLRLNRPRF